jgi:hypothetical protein
LTFAAPRIGLDDAPDSRVGSFTASHKRKNIVAPHRAGQGTLRRGQPRFGVAAQNPSANTKASSGRSPTVNAGFLIESQYRNRHEGFLTFLDLNLS